MVKVTMPGLASCNRNVKVSCGRRRGDHSDPTLTPSIVGL